MTAWLRVLLETKNPRRGVGFLLGKRHGAGTVVLLLF
jgi:hypothetical protein